MHPSRRTYLEIGALLCFLAFPCKYGGGLGGSAFAFQVETDPQSRIPMLDEGKGLIHLDLSVTNAEGEPVSGLDREDFELLDEGHPRKSLTFHAFDSESAKPNYPTQLVLFLDTLGLKFEKVSRMRIAITQFLRQNNGHLALPVSIFGFSDEGLWTVPDHDSNDGNALASDLAERKRIALMHRPDALRALSMIAAGQRGG
jgi:VWFA-related protein